MQVFSGVLPGWLSGKESACQCRKRGFEPSVGKIPWRRKWQPISVFLPEESHGQRSLAGYCPWGPKKLNTAWRLSSNSSELHSSWQRSLRRFWGPGASHQPPESILRTNNGKTVGPQCIYLQAGNKSSQSLAAYDNKH